MTPTQAGEFISDIKRAAMDGKATERLWAISARNMVIQCLEDARGSDLAEGLMVSQFLAEAIAKP